MAERKRGEIPPTVRGYNTFEVVSAYQKAIRRSDTDAAIYWGAELYKSGFGAWAWKRLRIIVSEDVGPAAPGLPADVHALHQTAKDFSKDGRMSSGLMFFVHATILAARAPKTRVVDWALFAAADVKKLPDREIPDEALDMHTLRGKQQGRGAGHFVREAGRLVQPERMPTAGADPVPADLRALENEYLEVFKSDQSRWRDPEDEDLDNSEPGDKPKLLPD